MRVSTRDPDILDFTKLEILNAQACILRYRQGDSKATGAIRSAADDLGISPKNMTPQRLASVRCCLTRHPKVKFGTLCEAKRDSESSPYPCSCLYWHRTTGRSKPKWSIKICPGCNLPFAGGCEAQRYCCKGCKRRERRERRMQNGVPA